MQTFIPPKGYLFHRPSGFYYEVQNQKDKDGKKIQVIIWFDCISGEYAMVSYQKRKEGQDLMTVYSGTDWVLVRIPKNSPVVKPKGRMGKIIFLILVLLLGTSGWLMRDKIKEILSGLSIDGVSQIVTTENKKEANKEFFYQGQNMSSGPARQNIFSFGNHLYYMELYSSDFIDLDWKTQTKKEYSTGVGGILQAVAARDKIFYTVEAKEGNRLYYYDATEDMQFQTEGLDFNIWAINTDGQRVYVLGKDDNQEYKLAAVDADSLAIEWFLADEETLRGYYSGFVVHDNKLYYLGEIKDNQDGERSGIRSYNLKTGENKREEEFGYVFRISVNAYGFFVRNESDFGIRVIPHDGSEPWDLGVHSEILLMDGNYVYTKHARVNLETKQIDKIPLDEDESLGDGVSQGWRTGYDAKTRPILVHVGDDKVDEKIVNIAGFSLEDVKFEKREDALQ